MVTRGGNGRIHNGHVVNGAIHNEASGGTQGCFLLGMSAFFAFVGGALCIVGPCLEQRRNTSYSNSTRVEYDLFFYQEKISIRNGASVTSPVSDCIQAPYSAAMAMAIIGAAITLLIALPLTYCAIKFKASPLRFIRPVVLLLGGMIAMIGVILTVTTTSCDGNDFGDDYKLTIGFFILVGGASVILLAAILNLLQAAICPEANPPSTEQVVIVHHQTATSGNGDQSMLFVPTNGAQQQNYQQQQQAGGAPAFNFASQQQQQHTGQPQGYGGGGGGNAANAGLYGGGTY